MLAAEAGVGDGEGENCPWISCCPLSGGVTPPGAEVPLAKFPEQAASASVLSAKVNAATREVREIMMRDSPFLSVVQRQTHR